VLWALRAIFALNLNILNYNLLRPDLIRGSLVLTARNKPPVDKLAVVYDGECPFCSWYVDQPNITEDNFSKINARENPQVVQQLNRAGIDIDRDMVLMDQGQMYRGADALYRLARDNRQSGGWFSKLQKSLFSKHRIAVVIYPILRLLRGIYLRISGRPRIH